MGPCGRSPRPRVCPRWHRVRDTDHSRAGVAPGGLGSQRRWIRRSHRVRALSAAELTWFGSPARCPGRRAWSIRDRCWSERPFTVRRIGQPALAAPASRARDLAGEGREGRHKHRVEFCGWRPRVRQNGRGGRNDPLCVILLFTGLTLSCPPSLYKTPQRGSRRAIREPGLHNEKVRSPSEEQPNDEGTFDSEVPCSDYSREARKDSTVLKNEKACERLRGSWLSRPRRHG